MANELKLGLVIGGAVSGTVKSAFKDIDGRIKSLDKAGAQSRAMQRNIGDTIKLREEWRKAHMAGSAGADGLRRKLEANLAALKREGVEVRNLGKAYEQQARQALAAERKAKGQEQIRAGAEGMGKAGIAAGVGIAAVGVAAKVSADYGAITRDIAIKAGIANKPEEAAMSRTIITTAQDSGLARNEVANVVNELVGAGMDLAKALEYAPVAAKFVVGQGADGASTAKMINALGQNAKITDAGQMQKALEAIAFQGQAGSFEAADMAKWFPDLLAGMGKLGITGNDSVAQLGAILQVQMKTAGSSDEAAGNLKNWMEKIGSGEVVKAYADVGIDYQGSMNTGLQNGKSTLESSFALAMQYVEKTDPKKAKAMSEGVAKIGKEVDPEKAKTMMTSLEQALRTGDLFADMQVKAALTAYSQNKVLYEQLKNDSASAAGILDKNLAERRETSSQKWKEVAQSFDDATRSVGDALRPITDTVADVLGSVGRAITDVSDKAPNLTMGITALGAAIVTGMGLLSTVKMGKGVINLARGAMGGRDRNAGALDGAADSQNPKSKLFKAGAGVLESMTGGGKDDGVGSGGTQKVFVVNAAALQSGGSGAAAGEPGARRGRGRGRRGRAGSGGASAGRRAGARRQPVPTAAPVVPSPAPTAPAAAVSPRAGVMARATSAASTASKFGRAVPGAALFEAGAKAVETYMSDDTAEKKAEGYGEAAGGLAGTMAGAAAGAAIGSVVPILGTAVGALVGGYLGSLGGEFLGGKAGKGIFDVANGGSEDERRIAAARPAVAPGAVTRNGEVPGAPSLGDVARSFAAPTEATPMAVLMKPIEQANAPAIAAAPPKVEQTLTMAPVFNVTVTGDVKDPRLLAQELMPEIKRQMDGLAKQATRRQMADDTHT